METNNFAFNGKIKRDFQSTRPDVLGAKIELNGTMTDRFKV